MTVTPTQLARIDQLRARVAAALLEPCTCPPDDGCCPTDDELRALLALNDHELLLLLDAAAAEADR